MALATRCPHCHTTYKVAHDQLKLRSGLVRCGSCQQIFNGVEHLWRPDALSSPTLVVSPQPRPVPGSEPKAQPAPVSDTPPSTAPESPARTFPATIAPDTAPSEQPTFPDSPDSDSQPHSDDPMQRMTLMDFTEAEDDAAEDAEGAVMQGRPLSLSRAANADQPDELERAIDDLQKKPWRGSRQASADTSDHADEHTEPSFVIRGRGKQRLSRATRWTMGVGSFFLLAALFGQAVYAFRSQIAAHLPQVRPMLVQACAALGCRVELLAQIDAVSIESSELQAVAADKNIFALTTLLRNHSATIQAWPNIELTLNDANEKSVARRVLPPREYLPAALDPNQGFAANSEQVIKVSFDLLQVKASGYRVYLFYP